MKKFQKTLEKKWKRFLSNIRLFHFIMKGGVVDMAMVYALLIVKGKKTFAEVPETLKEQVREILIDMECEHLITE